MNFLDRAIAVLAPERALRRARARQTMDVVMNFDGASRGRRTAGWKAPATDADAASLGARARLRNLSRDMIRNRPIAARAQSVVASNVVGKGVRFSVVSEDDAVKKAVTSVLSEHFLTPRIDALREQNVYGQQRTVINTVFSDGEILARRRFRNPAFEPDLVLPFQVELIEADHLDTTITSYGQNEVIDGVEIGPTGRAVAYHLWREHPGASTRWHKGKTLSERVDAADILHIRRLDRPGQLRGVPWLAPVMMTLGELSDYQEAEIVKQKIAALMAFIITSAEGENPYAGKGLEELAPGGFVGLEPGQTVEVTDPPTVQGYADFMRQGQRQIAAGVGLTYEAVSADLSGTNFTSFRAGRMEMDANVQAWQQFLIIDQYCEGVTRWMREGWTMAARRRPQDQQLALGADTSRWSLAWTPPVRPMVDPNKEIPAKIRSIEAGLSSLQREQRGMGHDPDLIEAERVEDAARPSVALSTTTQGTEA